MRYSDAVGSLSSTLRQVYKDIKIEPYKVLYWTGIVANKLLYQHLVKEIASTGWVSGEYLRTFIISVKNDGNKKYFDLPVGILNLTGRDDGIDHVGYNVNSDFGDMPDLGMRQWTRTTASKLPRLYYNVHEKPSPQNPYFYRVGDRAYTVGIETVPVHDLNVGLVMGSTMDSIEDINEEMKLPGHLYPQLEYEILKLGQFALMIPENMSNEEVKSLSKVKPPADEQQ